MQKTAPSLATASDVGIGNEPFRPHYHFTPRRNWMNDPNGLVYFEGEYHLFFQYNPEGKDWGNMSWGHAVSSDLVHWRELTVAIPYTDIMIFSGSIIVDWRNVSGLGDGNKPPLLAFFTAYDAERNIQSQHLAFSADRGRTFTHYAGNPILDLKEADFRDPKVFYHEESAAWIMTIVLARQHIVQFYRSQNLRDWTLGGTFAGAGSMAGQWECPDLILVPVEGHANEAFWVLKVDVDNGLVDGGSGAQYFVGQFDGHTFTIDPDLGDRHGAFVDYGPDFYAAVTWSDLPKSRTNPVWIGWQSNHQSGKVYPTDPWRGAMSLPRELFLHQARDRLWLGQRPVAALEALRGKATTVPSCALRAGAMLDLPKHVASLELQLNLSGDDTSETALMLCDDHGALLTLTLSFAKNIIQFERHASPNVPSSAYARSTMVPLHCAQEIDLWWFFDGSVVEIFAAGGTVVYSSCLFPHGEVKLELTQIVGTAQIGTITVWNMERSIDFST